MQKYVERTSSCVFSWGWLLLQLVIGTPGNSLFPQLPSPSLPFPILSLRLFFSLPSLSPFFFLSLPSVSLLFSLSLQLKQDFFFNLLLFFSLDWIWGSFFIGLSASYTRYFHIKIVNSLFFSFFYYYYYHPFCWIHQSRPQFWLLFGCLTCGIFLFLLKVAKHCCLHFFLVLSVWSDVFRFVHLLILVRLAYAGNGRLVDEAKIASFDARFSKTFFLISIFGNVYFVGFHVRLASISFFNDLLLCFSSNSSLLGVVLLWSLVGVPKVFWLWFHVLRTYSGVIDFI